MPFITELESKRLQQARAILNLHHEHDLRPEAMLVCRAWDRLVVELPSPNAEISVPQLQAILLYYSLFKDALTVLALSRGESAVV